MFDTINKYKFELFNIINNQPNKELEFKNEIFKRSWFMKSIKAFEFNEQPPEVGDCVVGWNKYCEKIDNLTGTVYREWIRDENFNVIGFLVFYQPNQNPIKTKHFDRWKDLIEYIKDEYNIK